MDLLAYNLQTGQCHELIFNQLEHTVETGYCEYPPCRSRYVAEKHSMTAVARELPQFEQFLTGVLTNVAACLLGFGP